MAEIKPKIKILIGLGNPGPTYKNTYHNAGSLFVDYVKEHLPNSKLQILNSKVFMNESGLFVKKSLKKFGLKPRELLVVQDDSDIPLGAYKLSNNRGAAGHKGIESIIDHLGSKEFSRLRIGIRRSNEKRQAAEFVLKNIGREGKNILENTFRNIVTAESVFAENSD